VTVERSLQCLDGGLEVGEGEGVGVDVLAGAAEGGLDAFDDDGVGGDRRVDLGLVFFV
jgi:hypothetical protein